MGMAVGLVEVLGHPPALSVADTMVKAAKVTFVGY
ncbi:MAG: BMC domain-containing protein, partial [Pseudanabaena sp.]